MTYPGDSLLRPSSNMSFYFFTFIVSLLSFRGKSSSVSLYTVTPSANERFSFETSKFRLYLLGSEVVYMFASSNRMTVYTIQFFLNLFFIFN